MKVGSNDRVQVMKMDERLERRTWLKERAREFGRAATVGEEILWDALRSSKLDGYKFRRQDPICGYVVDFRCPRCLLVVEIDGGVHEERARADLSRDAVLRGRGYEVVRIPDERVRADLDAVLAELGGICRQRDTWSAPGKDRP